MTPSTAPADFASMADVLRLHAGDKSDKTAFVFLDSKGQEAGRLSYGLLDQRVDDVAAVLVDRGFVGRTIALLFEPGLDFVVAFFACLRAGAIAVPMPGVGGGRTGDRIGAIYDDAEPSAILSTSFNRLPDALLAESGDSRPAPVRINVDDVGQTSASRRFDARQPGDLAFLQYTSGSTTKPKGVMLTQGNIIANNRMIAAAFDHDESLRALGWLPVFHDMGLIGHVMQPVFVGGLSVLMSPLNFLQRPIRWLEAISTWRATSSGGPSHGFGLCLRRPVDVEHLDLSSWKVAYCGSEPIRPTVLQRFADRFASYGFDARAYLPCYGLAEVTLLATGRPAGAGISYSAAHGRDCVSCGPSWAGSTISIEDPVTGEAVEDGAIGEICVSGPHVALGYWKQNQASQSAFMVDETGRRVRTGDRGYLVNNELFVSGRLKDIIIIMGINHAAEDLEATGLSSDAIFEGHIGAAFGIEAEDSEQAVLVHEISANVPSNRMMAAIEAYSAAVVQGHGIKPADIVLVKSGTLPRTSSGKIQRNRVRELYAAGMLRDLASMRYAATTSGAGC